MAVSGDESVNGFSSVHDGDGVRTGQAEAEGTGPFHQPGQGLCPAQQQVVDELPAGSCLGGDQFPASELVALGEDGNDVVDAAQHDLAGTNDGRRVLRRCRYLGQGAPQSPTRGQVEIEQGAHRDAPSRRPSAGIAKACQFPSFQVFSGRHRGDERGQEVGQQLRIDAAGIRCGGRGDRVGRRFRVCCRRHPTFPVVLPCPRSKASDARRA